mgnify:CR=1 FL=1
MCVRKRRNMDRKWCQCGGAREVIRELPVRREKQIMNKKIHSEQGKRA